jgi:hypothetical protein
MGMPCLQEAASSFYHKCPQPIQFVRTETPRFREADRLKPEFGNVVTVLDVDMRRLRSLQAVEEEAEAGNPL